MVKDSFQNVLEEIVAGLAQYGRHVRLVLYGNRTGQVRDGYGKIVFTFGSIEELRRKLHINVEVDKLC